MLLLSNNMQKGALDFLLQFNLDEREILTYKTCLQYGHQSAGQLAHNTGIKRPSVYVILDRLIEKGFIREDESQSTKRFFASSPRQVLTLLQNQEDLFKRQVSEWEELIPELEAIQKKDFQAPRVKFFRGEDSIARTYEEAVKSTVFRGIVNPTNIQDVFEEYFWNIAEALSKGKKDARDIVVDCALARDYKKRYENEHLQIRLISPEQNIMSDTMILDDKVFLLSFEEHEMMVLDIESPAIAHSQLIMFNALWESLEA